MCFFSTETILLSCFNGIDKIVTFHFEDLSVFLILHFLVELPRPLKSAIHLLFCVNWLVIFCENECMALMEALDPRTEEMTKFFLTGLKPTPTSLTVLSITHYSILIIFSHFFWPFHISILFTFFFLFLACFFY